MFVLMFPACTLPEPIKESGHVAQDLAREQLIQSAFIQGDGLKLHYVVRPSESKNLIVFVHGTPGNWSIFAKQLEDSALSKSATLVAIDRPGWGQSSVTEKENDPSLQKQSQLISPFLKKLKDFYSADQLVLVGHSLGASLVPKIAIDNSGLVDVVVAIAGDLTDDYPSAYWYNTAAQFLVIKWMISKEMAKANDEVIALEGSLAEMKSQWQDLDAPLLVLQGNQDGLVDPRHADFAQTLKTQNQVRVIRFEDAGHLFHLTHTSQVNEILRQVLRHDDYGIFDMNNCEIVQLQVC